MPGQYKGKRDIKLNINTHYIHTTMKKLFYLLAALPLLFFASCHDDDDLPDVNVSIDYSGAKTVEGVAYVVQGDTLSIDSVYVTPVNPNQRAIIGSVTYYLDQRLLGYAPVQPFSVGIPTGFLPVGNHMLRLEMSVFQEDRTPAAYYIGMPFAIVSDSTAIPDSTQATVNTYKDIARTSE